MIVVIIVIIVLLIIMGVIVLVAVSKSKTPAGNTTNGSTTSGTSGSTTGGTSGTTVTADTTDTTSEDAPAGVLGAIASALPSSADIIFGGGVGYGDWKEMKMCPEGSYICGAQSKIERDLGSGGDDTGMNGIKFKCCKSDMDSAGYISPGDGLYGDWHPEVNCPIGTFMHKARAKIESNQGDGDDTGMNGIQFYCKDPSLGTTQLLKPGDGHFGAWTDWKECPAGSYICGAGVKLEGDQGKGDDTGMNGAKFKCCKFNKSE
jgi:Vitelline membrane outer layer protein I (VOMI)